ncbi:sugar transferase [Actinopolymorpha pittospori]|uniref:Lipopolysaccharide/colanic/teichoic acid biosynthesis glycosyltransferase n=1 Tax=Actinopolymorpha pittospori TaxID=648752 RepID=A0A927MNM0_9ACTN|nr:sugar transferase [Actinopolymorpha pittospori]MBE1603277.1 lipopolysaccharide/colanic/teichoic acid biosynthesis glycosyltransferase [Actinopolymorpha pittospori]
MKRLFDVVVSAVMLVLLSPLLLVVAVLIKLSSPGPAFFRQERAGRHGRIFRIHKFRTMRKVPGFAVTSDTDPRITAVGRILRATKLDELPQLFDVLAGTMSLVGPRPEVPRYVEHWPPAARPRILSVRPGITDPASIAYRNESAELALAPDPEEYYLSVVLPRKVEMYLAYVADRTWLGDLRILAQTACAVVGR